MTDLSVKVATGDYPFRKIKFRAFHPDQGMCYFLDEPCCGEQDFWPFGIYVGMAQYSEDMSEWKFMLYTGLKDNSGREIYVGDIVRTHVGWTESGPLYENRVVEPDPFFGLNGIFDRDDVEVIGNICENADFLKNREL